MGMAVSRPDFLPGRHANHTCGTMRGIQPVGGDQPAQMPPGQIQLLGIRFVQERNAHIDLLRISGACYVMASEDAAPPWTARSMTVRASCEGANPNAATSSS